MSDKKEEKSGWFSNVARKLKMFVPSLILAASSCSAEAASPAQPGSGHEPSEGNAVKTEMTTHVTEAADSSFRAYSGTYYNQKCNGSPCWLASTYETNGAGEGRYKNISSVAMWNPRGNYRGLNQISPQHAQKFLVWLKGQEKYTPVYNSLKAGGVGKANWQKTARNYEHLMTDAFENYMVKEYNSGNMKAIQDQLNKAHLNVSLRQLHPAILSCMHQITVESPASRDRIAKTMIGFAKKHGDKAEAFNSEDFIKALVRNATVQKRAIKLLNDTSISWKQDQFEALLAKTETNNTHDWFAENTAASRPTIRVADLTPIPPISNLTLMTDAQPILPEKIDIAGEIQNAAKRIEQSKQKKKGKKAESKKKNEQRRSSDFAAIMARSSEYEG